MNTIELLIVVILIGLISCCIGCFIAWKIDDKFYLKPLMNELTGKDEKIKTLELKLSQQHSDTQQHSDKQLRMKAIVNENIRRTNEAVTRSSLLEIERRNLISHLHKLKQIADNREECQDIVLVANYMIEEAHKRANSIYRSNSNENN